MRSRWLNEVRAHSGAPVLLCGCMADLRTDENTVRYEIFSHQFFQNIFTYPYAIKNQRKARNAPSRGHFVPKPLVGGFGCLELVLYGIRELA